YNKNCASGTCNPLTCNPKGKIESCPHTTGAAVDIVCKGKSSRDSCQAIVKEIMLNAGFCQLTKEAWHFEYPLSSYNGGPLRGFSSKCTIVK
ncbi:MAG: hypothetical protein NUV82_04200, partial [Candidatus Komeilibacteria bacterium]|nr:hypothetical protein [Candidatus Komeilibacteria bacterium]